MSSSSSHQIKQRVNPNDVFITPLELAKKAIDMVDYQENFVWYDPFKNSGSYYNQFPSECEKEWSEILDGKDFFEFDKDIDVICSNPPYSLLDKVIEKSIQLKPYTINYLIGINNLTTRRIEMLNKANYGLTKIHMCKVWKWYGMSIIVQFDYDKENVISYGRNIWRE